MSDLQKQAIFEYNLKSKIKMSKYNKKDLKLFIQSYKKVIKYQIEL